MASDNNNQDTEEEISTVLRHFRPRPEFLSNNSGSSHEWMTSGTNKKQKKSLSRGFTSVQYVASPSSSTSTDNNNDGVGKIRLAYLHIHTPKQQGSNNNSSSSMPIFLTFEIAVDTKVIECVRCSSSISSSSSTDLQSDLNEKCSKLSTTTTNSDDAASLFLSASQLLKLLNDDFPDLIIGEEERETFFMLTSRIAKAIDDNKFAFQYNDMIDVQTLLIRCAAAGKQRSQVCAPVPVEFTSSASIRGDDTLSHLIFGASNQLYLVGFRGDGTQDQKSKQFVPENKDARTLLTFLLSLPWTGGSRLINNKASSSASGSSNQATKTTSSTSKMAKISIDIGTAMGSPSPAFTAQATKYGTIQAYHGTKIESAWSIINHGLINLSYHKLQSNGAMMGEGVYLSSSKQVADSFAQTAAQQKSAALASAFQHEALLHLLCFANVDISDLEPLEHYDITCLPVFEAMIIRPPSGDDDEDDDNDNLQCTTRQEGKYFVCTDSEFIRITKLHLTIELRKKTSMWGMLPRIPMWLIVVILALLWMIR